MTVRREIAEPPSRNQRAEFGGLAPPSDFGELSRTAAVPVPLLLRRGQAPKKRASVPNSTLRVRGASPLAEGSS